MTDPVQPEPQDDPIVGHKTFCDDAGKRWHEPLRQSEADAIWAEVEAAKERRERELPTVEDCLRALGDVSSRLEELGWRNAIYCPKDGSTFDAIEFGSTGIHACHYEGEWPSGSWWVSEAGDEWPSRPILFRTRTAKAIEAQRAETQGSVHESAVAESHSPNPPHNPGTPTMDEVTVTDADREAAADYLREHLPLTASAATRVAIRSGDRTHPLVRALARHREQSIAPYREALEEIVEVTKYAENSYARDANRIARTALQQGAK